MRQTFRWLVVLTLPFVLLLSAKVGAQGKKDNKDKDLVNSEKMIAAGVITGRVAAVYEEKRQIRLAIQVPRLNPGALNSIQQAQAQMALARMRGDFNGVLNAQRQLAQAQATLYTMQWQDIELNTQDDMIVRMANPRPSFDDKGRLKKLTRAELKELKGDDPKLPGYKAEFSDIQTDQIVQVTLVRKKNPGPINKPVRKGKKDADAEVPDPLGDHLPLIKQILILHEPMRGS
jgi:hypothetical protein